MAQEIEEAHVKGARKWDMHFLKDKIWKHSIYIGFLAITLEMTPIY